MVMADVRWAREDWLEPDRDGVRLAVGAADGGAGADWLEPPGGLRKA